MAIPRNLANIAPHVNASGAELVVNDGGADLDFRVESDTNANVLVVDAGVNKVGIGTNTFNTNGGVLQVANGISFPATQSATTDANTLDDYEEGTWTPAWSFSTSGSATVVVQGSWYVKIGRLVTVQARFYTNTMTGVGNASVTGLPFTGSGTNAGSGSAGEFFRTATDFQDKGLIAVVASGSTSINFYYGATTNNTTGLQGSDLNTTTVQNIVGITLTYLTTA